MAWASAASTATTGSHLFRNYFLLALNNGYGQNSATSGTALLGASNIKAALYDGTITSPDANAANAATAYGGAGSTWVSTSVAGAAASTSNNQLTSVAGWPVGGVVVGTPTFTEGGTAGTGYVQFSSAPIVSSTSTATITSFTGMYLYFDGQAAAGGSVAKPGLGFWYFSATPLSVTNGLLTITPDATNGLFRINIA